MSEARVRGTFSARSIFLCLVFALPAAGQTTFGSITGTVTDQTGALIARAKVTVVNEGTGTERPLETTNAGVFDVPNLSVGTYRVRIQAAGFRDYERTGLVLNANQVMGLDVQLSVAGATTEVQVVGAAPVIDTETATLNNVKPSRDLEQLPLINRTKADSGIYGFASLNPGVSGVANSNNPVVNGNRSLDTMPTMDGIAVVAYLNGTGGGPVQVGFESVEQVNMELASTPAEFARPTTLTVVSKSGTNTFHGTAYYDYNGSRLNARNFFSATVPFRVYHDFATSLGGPIRKNKTFFFIDYEGSREAASVVLTGNTPLVPWRSGDFSTGVTPTIIDPTNGQPFPNKQIPATRISPVSQKIQDFFYPLPNYGSPTLQSGNWRGQAPGTSGYTHFDNVDGRIDHNLGQRDLIFGRFSYRRVPNPGNDNNLPPVGVWHELRNGRSAVLSWTHTFSPSLLNEFRTGMTRISTINVPGLIGGDIIQQVGIQGIPQYAIHAQPIFTIPGITTTDQADPKKLSVATGFQYTDNLSLTLGSHFLKFGFDALHDQSSYYWPPNDIYGTYNFTGAYTGFGYADFLLGIPQTTSRTVPPPERYVRGTIWSLYAQDQYKLSRTLTLNFGLRWELQSPYYEKFGNLYTFDRQNGSLIVADSGMNHINPLYPKNIPIMTASQAGYPGDSLVDFNKKNFYPRFGFAYKPLSSHKLVIRGGYGIYGDTIYGLLGGQADTGPFSGSESFTNSLTNGVPLFSFPNPFLSVGTTATQNVSGANPHLKVPYSQQFNLTVEQQVGPIGIRVAYVGTRNVDLVYTANINYPPPSTVPFTASRRIYPLYNVVTWRDNGGTQEYNALQVSAFKTYGKNLFFNTGWTWAKDLTDTPDSGFAGTTIQNAYDRRADRGNTVTTRPHRVYISAIYTLPVGKGQHFLSNANRVVNGVLGGWSTSWVAVLESGAYFTPTYSGFDSSNTNNIGGRPDVIGNPNLSSGQSTSHWFNAAAFAIPGCPASNPVCTNPANVGRFGNAGLYILRGPADYDASLSVTKYFRITERARVQFGMLGTSIFNHPNFGAPAANISSPGTVGQITSSSSTRQIHFNLRLEF